MSLDPALVREAKATRELLLASQHAAERARADYHHATRRLHAAGGSLREIAEALGLSHQRVHQIIDEAAEPTRWRWRRHARRPQGPLLCSFCGRSRKECAKLIAGPGVSICDRCVAQATRLSAGAPKGWTEGPMRLEAPGSEARCSFCGKQAARHGALLVAGGREVAPGGKLGQDGTRICDECLDLCLGILAEPASS